MSNNNTKRTMIKRLIFSLMALASLTSYSQTLNGSWTTFPVFSGDFTQVVETPTQLLVAFPSSIMAYDKTTGAAESYDSGSKLNSSSGVAHVLYNPAGAYTAVAYTDCSIDILFDNGKVLNMPQIANYVAMNFKTINSLSFDGTDILVATTFGIVRIDPVNNKVVDFKNYKTSVTAIARLGDNYVMAFDGYIYGAPAPADRLLPAKEDMTSTGYGMKPKAFLPVNDTKVAIKYSTGAIGLGTYKPATTKISITTLTSTTSTSNFTHTASGVVASNASQLITVNAADGTSTVTTLSDDAANSTVTCYNGLQQAWSVNASGFACFDLSNGVSEIKARAGIDGTLSVPSVERISVGKSGKTYITTRCQSTVLVTGSNYTSTIDCINTDGTVEHLSPTVTTKSYKNTWGMNDWATLPYSVTNILESAVDPNTYYYSTWWSGFYKITNGQMAANYNWSNSPLSAVASYANDVTSMAFDRHNNLWVTGYFDSSKPDLYCLPADKLNNAPNTADWVTFSFDNFATHKDVELITSTINDRVFVANYEWKGRLAVLDFNGTPTDTSDDSKVTISEFFDTDGNEIDFNYIYCLAEDKNGVLWLGTSGGILSIPQDELFGESPRFNHIRVAATNAYLLDSNATYAIVVDNNNNKWFGTNNGLLQTTPDGTIITANYTTSNSPLPSNLVYSLGYDDSTNSVKVGTSAGLVIHNPSGSAAAANYDNVYAYPNTIGPDYTGWVTIRGLMNASAVNIVDQNGVTKFSDVSDGGTLMWNLIGSDGIHVGPGVYSVTVDIDGTPTAVAKIVVVR